MKLSRSFHLILKWFLFCLIWVHFSPLSAEAAYLPQRGPAPLRWRPQPEIADTNAVASTAQNTASEAALQGTHSPTRTSANSSPPPANKAPSADSPEFVGPLLPPAPTPTPTPTTPSTEVHVQSGSSDSAAHSANPTSASSSSSSSSSTSVEFVAPGDTGPIVIGGGPESRTFINAQMLVRFFQGPDRSGTNGVLDVTAGALPATRPRGHAQNPSHETAVLIPVQFLPPEPFSRPPNSGSSATYTVSPKP